mmetsp:Transcript_24493/g.69808  ORF Transcript_24493/g.69808 Transcript_24493/m.69808 type:complete len:236 (+) Transcript_24493:110-817(+)|eukprot:CAMPEP_0176252940 /NCGR_PEP_ID=MMETSP0121_2-20121125/35762_1 /TAXON_ID=160619 /ORGANISM="Kryptoperidinium foliaceum, Strain CCMP 1326" /LENGTH=235 /DNA_ID=CAMNT_0017592707 /DNA_START=56 /DNA_END=763 /DNA_ORIENTATION=-
MALSCDAQIRNKVWRGMADWAGAGYAPGTGQSDFEQVYAIGAADFWPPFLVSQLTALGGLQMDFENLPGSSAKAGSSSLYHASPFAPSAALCAPPVLVAADEPMSISLVLGSPRRIDVPPPPPGLIERARTQAAEGVTMQDAFGPADLDAGGAMGNAIASHEAGECKPCIYFMQAICMLGDECTFCHADHATTKWKRSRAPKHVREKLKAYRSRMQAGTEGSRTPPREDSGAISL